VNPLTEKSANVLVRRVYLADHKGLYQNPRLHPLSPTPKTHYFKPRKLRSAAVPEFTVSVTAARPTFSGTRIARRVAEISLPSQHAGHENSAD
jgi:hypothetical protein